MIYSRNEMRARYERTRQLLKKYRLDALLITNEENFIYFTGSSGTIAFHYSNTRPAVAIVSLWTDPICVVSTSAAEVVSKFVKTVREYTSLRGIPDGVLVRTIRDAGLKFKRIGIEAGLEQRLGLPYADFERVKKKLGNYDVRFADATSILWKLRMVKSRQEIAYMKEAARITARARAKSLENIAVGMTHRDVARIFGTLMYKEGADRVAFVHVDTNPPYNHTMMHFDGDEELGILKTGDLLALDGGAYVRAYCVDYPRMATIGQATTEQIRNHKVIRNINRSLANNLRAGVKCSTLFKVAYRLLRAAGVEALPARRMGHGQGMLLTEPPSIADFDDTVLEAGTVVSTEPSFKKKAGVFCLEDVHVVVEDGYETITPEPDEMREIKV